MARRFVMLDRDGVVNIERGYVRNEAQVELIPRVGNALRLLQGLGLGLVIVTNQSGVGRGFFSLDDLGKIHSRLQELLFEQHVSLDGIYFCPHRPDEECQCRKPRPGLVSAASAELAFDPAVGFLVGDKALDIELGQRVGATTFLVRTGYGADFADDPTVRPDYVVADLWQAAGVIERLVSGDKNNST